jgi:two-component system OmpR family sensor kinase
VTAGVPVQLRLTIVFAVVMAMVLAAAGVFVHERLKSNLNAAIETTLRARSADLAALAQQSDSGLKDAARSGAINRRAQLAQIFDEHGRLLDQTSGLGRHALITPSGLARAHDTEPAAVDARLGDKPIRVLAVPVRAQGQTLVVVVGQSLEERNRALSDLSGVLLLGGSAALLLASLAGYLLIGRALRPVEAMRRRERAFVADASHELRTPLTVLRGELELIGRDRPTGPELQNAVASAVEETERLGRLADDLLLLTRADSGESALRVTAQSAGAMLAAAVSRATRRAPGNAARITVESGAEAEVLVDRDRVAQALDNMVDNALRYARSSVALSADVHESIVDLHVRDDGPGFPSDFLPRAWDRFARADSARSEDGSGLGLAIVRTVADLHGGGARVVNRPEGGADIWISLPRADVRR